MRKTFLLAAAVLCMAIQWSCSSDSSSSSNSFNQSLIHGWWYSAPEEMIYKGYYFGADGVFKQDMSNLGGGMGEGTWVWTETQKIKMTPIANIVGGPQDLEIIKLTNDSLVAKVVAFNRILKLSRTNHYD